MELYILRHAIAEERSPKWRDDSKRPLTEEGVKKMRDVAKGMLALELEFDFIITSPFVRAKHTADIVEEVFKTNKLRISKNLASGGEPRLLVEELNSHYHQAGKLLLVGHEPYLSSLISLFTVGGDSLSLELKKGGLAKLTVGELRHGRCARLDWLLTPRQLRSLA
jgi:phosphohistidine phosphatase